MSTAMRTAQEALHQRANLVVESRKILDASLGAGRDMSAEEQSKYNAMEADIEKLGNQSELLQRQEQREAELRARSSDPIRPIVAPHEMRHRAPTPEEQAFRALFISDSEERKSLKYKISAPTPEQRALQADSGEAGGFLLAPQMFVADLIKTIDNRVVVRQKATKFQLKEAASMGSPSLDADPEDGTWTAEIQDADEDTQMDFGKRELKPHQLAKMIKVSRKLMRLSSVPIEKLVRDRLAYKFAVTEETHFWTGNGAGQPLGMLVASNDGIPTSRDTNTGSATGFTGDGLIDAQDAVNENYNNEWYFHPNAIKLIRKLKDGQQNYLWQPGLQVGNPDVLLSRPINKSRYISNTYTNGLYAGIYGDLSYYWIADSLAMEIEREDHLYTLSNRVAFIARMEVDGAPVLADAFTRLKCAA